MVFNLRYFLVILKLEETIKENNEQNSCDKLILNNKCSLLQEYQIKAEKELEDRQKEIATLEKEVTTSRNKIADYEKDCKERDGVITKVTEELNEEKAAKKLLQVAVETKEAIVSDLKNKLDIVQSDEAMKNLRNEEWVRAGQKEFCKC
jgi:chromosome segregation ATPase